MYGTATGMDKTQNISRGKWVIIFDSQPMTNKILNFCSLLHKSVPTLSRHLYDGSLF